MIKISVNKSRSLWWIISAAIIAAGILAMIISSQTLGYPLRPGLDFIGGTRLQVERDCSVSGNCDQPIDINNVREVAKAQNIGDSNIQIIGEDGNKNGVLIRSKNLSGEERSQLQSALAEKIGKFDQKKTQIDTVGPTLGKQLFSSGILALTISFIGIVVYLAIRFQLDYAVFAVIATFHDIFVTVGIFAIFGLLFNQEVNSLFVVALLTITGFSVNDTVVIYDRIRETLKANPQRTISEVVDDAVNQTLGRSINTTFTTLLPLLAIYIFGGETLRNFSLALIIGFLMGAYSSIFIASTLLAWWRERNMNYTPVDGSQSVDASVDS